MASNGFFTIIGYLAATLTTFCFLPQLLHTFKTKSVGDLHLGSMILFDLGLMFWLLYGIHLHSWPVILANAITLTFQMGLLGLKFRYRKTPRRKETQLEREISKSVVSDI
jgi:MtN3 and saliva related transmembrane protein